MPRKMMFSLYVGIEVNLLIGFIYILSASIGTFQIIPHVLFTFAFSFVMVYALEVEKKYRTPLVITAFIALFIIGLFVMNILLILLFIIFLLVIYRIYAHRPFAIEDRFIGRFIILLGAQLVLIAPLNIFNVDMPTEQLSVYILGMFVLSIIYITLTFITPKSEQNDNNDNRKLLVGQGSFILLLLTGLVVIYFTLPWLEAGFSALIGSLITLVTFIATPIFELMRVLMEWLASGDPSPQNGDSDAYVSLDEQEELEVTTSSFNAAWIFTVLATATFVTVAILLLRKILKSDGLHQSEENLVTARSTLTNPRAGLYRSVQYSSAGQREAVRKEVEKLEHSAMKLGVARAPGETLEEWLSNMTEHLPEFDLTSYTAYYEDVRYGHEEMDKAKTEWFKKESKRIRKHLK